MLSECMTLIINVFTVAFLALMVFGERLRNSVYAKVGAIIAVILCFITDGLRFCGIDYLQNEGKNVIAYGINSLVMLVILALIIGSLMAIIIYVIRRTLK
jgi:hypothetical protein